MKIFKEEQLFTQLWLIVVIIFSSLVPIYLVTKEYMNNENGSSIGNMLSIIILISLPLGIIFLFKLTTRIDEQGIHYQFFPFHLYLKKIGWNEISNAYVRTYDPIGEYGGWGIKFGLFGNKARGNAVNISGDLGIQLELKNGKKLLIGTQKESEAKRVLETYKINSNE